MRTATKKRSAVLILALWMLALSACSQSEVNTDENAAAPSASDIAADQTILEEEADAEPTIYDKTGVAEGTDFGGEVFNSLVYTDQTWGHCQFVPEEITGEVLNDAFFNRNLEVENMLNIDITETIGDPFNMSSPFSMSVQAGDNAYQTAFMRQQEAASCAMKGMCLDLRSLDGIDLTHSWWDQHSIEELTMDGKNYLVASEISIADKDAIWIIYFDKQIHAENQFESLYDLVDSGKWTQDKMMEMMDAAAMDLDGDGDMDYDDRWGLLTHSENYAASWMAAGERLVRTNADGIPEAAFEGERFVDVWDKTIKLMKRDSCYAEDIGFISSGLKEGSTLFATEVVSFLRAYRENERDFGVIPMPKYDEAQESYHTYVAEGTGLMILPKSLQNLETTGPILEMLAATGQEQVLPAYFDVCLKTRDSRDEESGRSLDISFNTRCYDIGMMFDWGGIASTLKNGIDSSVRVTSAKGNLMKTQMKKAFKELGIEVKD